jgi:hypothetical protein
VFQGEIQRRRTVGRTLAINWLPVTERAKSTIIARRELLIDGKEASLARNEVTRRTNLRLGWLTHALDDSVQHLFPTFLESLGDGLVTLLIGSVFEKASGEMI